MTLAQVRRIAMGLQGAAEQPHFEYTSFRVGGKIFATAPPDGGRLHVFVDEEQRAIALARAPGFLEPLPWGARIVGLRVELARANPGIVTELLEQAWSARAPKRKATARKKKSPARRRPA